MTTIACKCGSTNLKAKWNSKDGVGWICCDDCGNISTPVRLSEGSIAIITQWNKENQKSAADPSSADAAKESKP